MNLLHFGSDLADTWNPGSRSVIQDSYPDTIIWLRQLKFKGRYTWHWWECLLLACSVVSSCFVLLLSMCTERTECTQHFEHEWLQSLCDYHLVHIFCYRKERKRCGYWETLYHWECNWKWWIWYSICRETEKRWTFGKYLGYWVVCSVCVVIVAVYGCSDYAVGRLQWSPLSPVLWNSNYFVIVTDLWISVTDYQPLIEVTAGSRGLWYVGGGWSLCTMTSNNNNNKHFECPLTNITKARAATWIPWPIHICQSEQKRFQHLPKRSQYDCRITTDSR